MEVISQDFYRQLKDFVYRKVRNKQDTEDIVQDVYLKVQTKGHQLRDNEKLTGWLYTVTRNAIIDHFRAQHRRPDGLLYEVAEEKKDFNECVENCLKQLMVTLPPDYKEALELTELQNVSQKELAKRLSISYSGAKSRVQRARQMLKEKMHELYRIETDPYGNVIVCEDRVSCGCD